MDEDSYLIDNIKDESRTIKTITFDKLNKLCFIVSVVITIIVVVFTIVMLCI